MTLLHEFKREERLPSYFMNRIQDFLGAARTDLRVVIKSPTELEVAPVEPYGVAAIDLQGRWRFRTTAVTRAHPGGLAGTYTVWAVAADQKVLEAPKPFTDETDYSFDLRVLKAGVEPSGAGAEAVFEKIAEIVWNGAQITALRQIYNAVTGAMIEDGALSGSGDLEWVRDASGAWIPNLKAGSVGAPEIAGLSVTTGKIEDASVTEAKLAAALLDKLQSGFGQRLYVAETTRTNTVDGSFGTPLKVTLPKVFKSQLVYVSIDGYFKNSKVSAIGGTGGQIRLWFNGTEEAGFEGLWSLSESTNELPAETWAHVVSVNLPFNPSLANSGRPGPFSWNRDAYGLPGSAPSKKVPLYWFPFPWRVSADATNYTVEVTGKSSNGTISAGQFAMNVWVVG